MKLYLAFSILVLFYISAIAGQKENVETPEIPPKCSEIRDKLTKNINLLDNISDTAQNIQQRDCNYAKNTVKLTKKYGKCLNQTQEMETVYNNMRFVSRIICENVNKRILGCFSPENLKQFNKCTNKTVGYLDFMSKQKAKAESAALSADNKLKTRKRRFLLQNVLQNLGDGLQGRTDDGIDGKNKGASFPGLSILSSFTQNLAGNLPILRNRSPKGKSGELTPMEQQCCGLHLQSDCFLTKVLHTCAEKSELRLYKAFQTIFSLAVRDIVDISCGRIETLDQCEKFSTNWDAEQDLGF